MTDPNVAYPLRDAATRVGVSVDTLRRAYQDGHISFKTIGGKYFVGRSELERWFAALPAAVPNSKKRAS